MSGKALTAARADSPIDVRAISFNELERMAKAIADSKMFACKDVAQALTLCLVAQSEGIHPAQALMDYDLIQGKPALKSAAMLARFQRSGGKVKWLQATDAVVEGTFTHPSCESPVTVKWDNERLVKAGLADRDMHKKFPLQLKRARCITEGVRATAPGCIPVGMYTVEETIDTPAEPAAVQVARTDLAQTAAVEAVVNALTETEIEEHIDAMVEAPSLEKLDECYVSAYKHAEKARDNAARLRFKAAKEARAEQLKMPGKRGELI